MVNGIQKLQDFLSPVFPLKEEDWKAFSGIWKPVKTARKTLLTRAGETERHLYFVLDGIQRSYFQDDAGREATLVFTYPYSFSGVADSFLTQSPSRFCLETLSASSFLQTDWMQLSELMAKRPAIQQLIMRFTALALKGVLERQVELQLFSAEEKFRQLMHRSPHVLNLIPHKYLASYLGLDASTFSRLLGTVRL